MAFFAVVKLQIAGTAASLTKPDEITLFSSQNEWLRETGIMCVRMALVIVHGSWYIHADPGSPHSSSDFMEILWVDAAIFLFFLSLLHKTANFLLV